MSDSEYADAGSIGMATMDEHGTITIQINAEGGGGERGDAVLTFTKDDAKCASVLEHLGGLEPGKSAYVKPW